MNTSEALVITTEKLETILRGSGFTRTPRSDSFTKMIPHGRQSVAIPVWNHYPGVQIALLVNVRLDAVENVFHMFSGTPNEFHNMSDTIVTRFNHFSGGPERTGIRSRDELIGTLDGWEGIIQSKVLRYFDEAIDVVALDRMVNREPRIPDTTLPPYCYMRQIILAKFAGNPRFDELAVNHVDRLIRDQYPTDLYAAVLAHLDPDYV